MFAIGPPRPKKRKCLYLIQVRERGNWTWNGKVNSWSSVWWGLHLKEEVKALEEHPVEAGEVEEVGEGEGGAEEGLGELGGDQVLPREGEDPVERRQAEGAEQPHVDLVTQAAHLPGGWQ